MINASGQRRPADRVYLLVGRQVRITIAADVATSATARLREVARKLQQAIAAAKAAGKDVSAAEAKLAEMNHELDAVALAGAADTLLAVTPSPDAEAIKAATSAARAKVRTARSHFKAAVADAKAIRDLLKK
jgi:hypothetical protein